MGSKDIYLILFIFLNTCCIFFTAIIIPRDQNEQKDEVGWRWRGWKPRSVGGWKLICRADALDNYCLIWVTAYSAECHVSTSGKEHGFCTCYLLVRGRGELFGDFWLKQLTQQHCTGIKQTNHVKLFPIGKIFWIVLPHSFSLIPEFGSFY